MKFVVFITFGPDDCRWTRFASFDTYEQAIKCYEGHKDMPGYRALLVLLLKDDNDERDTIKSGTFPERIPR